MRIFISWSGKKAEVVASGLKKLLESINPAIRPWYSKYDIKPGQRWNNSLQNNLRAANYGIICITNDSMHSPWVLFETGALSNSVTVESVCPYLIDVEREQLQLPLSQFQGVLATRAETLEMIRSINFNMDQDSLNDVTLIELFEQSWPVFESLLKEVNDAFHSPPFEIREMIMKRVPQRFDKNELTHVAFDIGLSFWKINWDQSGVNVLREMVDVAIEEKTIGSLIQKFCDERPNAEELQTMLESYKVWEEQISN